MKPASPEHAVFAEALLRTSPEARAAYLDGACGADTVLRSRVEALLTAAENAGDFLERPPTALSAGDGSTMVLTFPSEKPGDRIGRYKLLQQIGEGGCGVVYMAEQEEPVRRRVALKVIKLGMDTKSVIARFEAERQALALMDHPNIAKVLDAGSTETGRPYFVMELVRGIKITDYCDQNNLPTAERLKLITQVCQAIQHAHQKGIIHRDIKPSNILVTVSEPGSPGSPKVIDFGIAKATTGQRLTDKTVFTAFEQFIGTPAYMSPEQAMMTSLDIDTRTDIYALGVLLYELLTGRTPFEAGDLMAAGLDAMRRIIREQEPVRPSTRLSTMMAADLTTVASQRRAEPGRLGTLLRGDLDWIVMKALEKDRTRRYETANGLAADIQRHLNNEPVLARPPGNLYRCQKLIRRNKLAFAATSAVVAALVVGFSVSTWMFFKEKQAHQRATTETAKSQRVAQFLKDMLKGVGPSVALGRDTAMLREILDQTAQQVSQDLHDQPLVEADLRQTLGQVYADISEWPKAAEMQRQSLGLRKKFLGDEHPDVASVLCDLGTTLHAQSKFTEAEPMLRAALAMRRKLLGNEHPDTARSLTALALPLHRQGQDKEAETLAREALAIQKKIYGDEHQDIARTLNVLAAALRSSGRAPESEAILRQVLGIQKKLLGDEHPEIALTLVRIAVALNAQGKPAEAETFARESLAMRLKLQGNDHGDVAYAMGYLASVLVAQDKLDEAEPLLRESLAMNQKHLGAESEGAGYNLERLGELLQKRGKPAEAETFYRQALDIFNKMSGGEHKGSGFAMRGLSLVLEQQGKLDQAAEWRTKLTEFNKSTAIKKAVVLKP